jgi:general secretion pathway protein D
MKQFAVFFLVVTAILFCGEMEKTLPQEKETRTETKIENQEIKGSTTTAIITPSAKPAGKAREESGGGTKPAGEEKGGGSKEPEEFKKGVTDKKDEEVEDLKSRFRKMVEDEMKKFGALADTASEEGTELKEEKKKDKKKEDDKKAQKRIAAEKREKEAVSKRREDEGFLEDDEEDEEVLEEGEEGALEGEMPEEIAEVALGEPEKSEEGQQKIALDFEDADIKEVVTALAEILGINYIIDPKVRGKVNIHTSGEISVEDIFPILETIFEVNGVAAVKVGNIYKIMPVKNVKKQPLIPRIGKELEDISSPDRLIFQIVPLRYIDPKEMEKIVKNFLGPGGVTVDYPEKNILIIIDTVANMKKLLRLIDTVDVSVFDRMHVRFYELENSEAKDLAKELENLFKALGVETKKKKGGERVSFIPIERMNIILAVSSMPDIFDKVDDWIDKLDEVREDFEEQIFIYFVENAKAIDIGDIIKELYGDRRTERDRRTTTTRRKTTDKKKRTTSRVSRSRSGLETATGEVKIVVDEINNAILVRATPQDYAQVLKTIKLLDTIPNQVLIEVLIAEVTLDSTSEFGVEWSYKSDYAALGGYKGTERWGQNLGMGGLGQDLTKPLGQSGFTYAFAADALEAFLRAYARENEVNILSSPSILVADNTEATIEVGEEVPIVTSEYTPSSIQSDTSFSRSIEYRDTGILLTVTPRINERGLVAMEVNQEVSNVSEQRIEGIDSPIILKRQAQTTLVVQDGKTIVIGGLIRESKDMTQEGLPFLSKIPYLGMLFSFNREISKKTELLFLITPHVVQTFEEAEFVTMEFKEKVEGLQKLLEKK